MDNYLSDPLDSDDVVDLLQSARQDLRRVYMTCPILTETEKAFIKVLQKILRATEMVDGKQQFSSAASPESSGSQNRKRKFVISFPEITLDEDQIWPEGDAPEFADPEDVIDVMRQTKWAHPMTVADDWRLIDTLYVRFEGDENGDMEIEWDGSPK